MYSSFSRQQSEVYVRRMTQIRHLPLAASELANREQELSFVTKQLSAETRLLTLIGPGGVGKTHLAVYAAWQLQDRFERVVFVDLSSAKTQLFTRALLHALDLDAAHTDLTRLVHELSAHKTLLVLDSFETVLGAAPVLSDLVARCPTLVTLVTSRSPLGLRLETSMAVQPFTPNRAFTFFLRCAKACNPPYVLETYQEDIQKLCERLDGLPLALELAAACTAHMTPEALLAHLSQHPSLPQLERPDRPIRQQNLGAVVDSSIRLLSVSEQRFFYRLSVITGSFTVETAEAITASQELGLETLSTLIKLRNYGLLTSELTTPPRFKVLETAKAVASASLSSSPDTTSADTSEVVELTETRTRHLQHYHALAHHFVTLLKSKAMLGGLELFSQEQANIRSALHWSLEINDTELKKVGASLVVTNFAFWHLKGQMKEADAWLETFRSTYPAPLQAAWLWALGSTKSLLDDNQEGIALAKESLHLAHSLKDKPLVAKALTLLGTAHRNLDHFEKALEYSQEACKLAKELGKLDLYVAALNNTALSYENLGETVEAKQLFEEALCVAQDIGNLFWQAVCTNNLALLVSYSERIPLFQNSLTLLQELGDTKRMSLIYVNLTDAHYRLGRYWEAQAFAEQGLTIAEQADDRFHIALNFNNLGLLARQRGELAKAEHYFRQAIGIFQELGIRSREAEVQADWARCYRDDPPRAAQHYLTALNVALETKTCVGIVSCLDGLAELEVLAGRFAQAVLVWSVAKQLWKHPTSSNFITEELLEQTKTQLDKNELANVLQKGAVLNPQQLFYDLCRVWGTEYKRKSSDVLSVRQQDILKLVAQGCPSKKIAKVFGLSVPTIKYHLREVFDKLGVNSRAEAVAQARQRGLL